MALCPSTISPVNCRKPDVDQNIITVRNLHHHHSPVCLFYLCCAHGSQTDQSSLVPFFFLRITPFPWSCPSSSTTVGSLSDVPLYRCSQAPSQNTNKQRFGSVSAVRVFLFIAGESKKIMLTQLNIRGASCHQHTSFSFPELLHSENI